MRAVLGLAGLAIVLLSKALAQAPPASAPPPTGHSLVVSITGKAEVQKVGTTNWMQVAANDSLDLGDRFRTSEKSRAVIRLPNLTVLHVNERSSIEIRKPITPTDKPSLDLKAGAAYFFGRGQPGEIGVRTPTAVAAIRGTEFNVAVAEDGRTVVTLLEGAMDFSSEAGNLSIAAGEQVAFVPGSPPSKTAVVQAINIIQWALYYPGTLDVAELTLGGRESELLSDSLRAYSAGNLLKALSVYPAGRIPESDGERIYFASLLLAAGQVEQAEENINPLPAVSGTKTAILREALREMVAAVKGQARSGTEASPQSESSPSWLVAHSYYLQAQLRLDAALSAARQAALVAPKFGFAWGRLAELEFSFGRIDAAKSALDQALALSPQNAQAMALRGFILAAENWIEPAKSAFEQAIALDSNLGNAWLGRGLSRIRQGDLQGGLEDLQTAAALEPNRAFFRSYLGKAFDAIHNNANARRELDQARRLDSGDPTSWLYSALLNYDRHEINRAVSDLEQSLELNENRRLYRSGLLLDQDRAVRSANLANLYRSAGFDEVSVREAVRAVADDYASFSGHRFLADSFNALRDPTRFNLRYETVWFNESLLADLLSPVGAGTLSQNVSQYEYSKLFEENRLGLNSSMQVRSDGQLLEFASQFGTFGNTSYSLDLEYQHNDGVRPNNELSRIEWYSKIKQQLTPHDTVFLLTKYQDYHSGDNFQYYDPDRSFHPRFFYDEFQSPYVVGAYHREWSPGVHTLVLGGTFRNEQHFGDEGIAVPLLNRNAAGVISRIQTPAFDLGYDGKFTFQTAELNQIFQTERSTLVLGARYQNGEFATHNRLELVPGSPYALLFAAPAFDATPSEQFERTSGYAYLTEELWDRFHLTAGLTYDRLSYPLNHRTVPWIGVEAVREQWSPKLALVWEATKDVTIRAMASRFLGGVSFDESYRLEPSQLAGFSQAYRNIIPESVVGSVAGPRYRVSGVGLDLKLPSRTYAGLQAEWLGSELESPVGAFSTPLPITAISLQRQLDYTERGLSMYLDKLVGDDWSVGGSYTFRGSSLRTTFPEIPISVSATANNTKEATLHQVNGFVALNHNSGFFGRFDVNWYSQDNRRYQPNLPGDEFPQLDLRIGYRLPRKLGSLTFGVLNLTDRDYRLNPLNAYSELPRERVFMAKLNLQF